MEIGFFVDVLECLFIFIDELVEKGIVIFYFDVGGGLGVIYNDEVFLYLKEYVVVMVEKMMGCE